MKRPWTLVPLSQPTPATHETPEHNAEMERIRARYAALTPTQQKRFVELMERAGAWWHGKDE